jgi:group I intron endonuclease
MIASKFGVYKAKHIPDRTHVVYKITNSVTGFVYIGSTVHPRIRWLGHMATAKNGKHTCPLMCEDYKKYGEPSFTFEVIATFENTRDMWNCEAMLIKEQMKIGNCYNVKAGI